MASTSDNPQPQDISQKGEEKKRKKEINLNPPTSPVPRSGLLSMNKDSSYTYIHMGRARDSDLFEDFCKDRLPDDDIYVPPQHQPINPEDEDDVVPDQHAAFGITKATQRSKEPAWRDLGLAELMKKGPPPGSSGSGGRAGAGGAGGSSSGGRGGGNAGRGYAGLPR